MNAANTSPPNPPPPPGIHEGPPVARGMVIKPPPKPRHPFLSWLQRSLITGIVVATPLTVTIFILQWFAVTVYKIVKPAVPEGIRDAVFVVPGIGVLIAIAALIAIGAVTANLFGRTLVKFGDSIVDRVPIVRTIYGSLKQVVQTVANQDQPSFKQVALMQFPRPGIWAMVFITNDPHGDFARKLPPDYVTVLLSTPPNPASGMMLFVPRSELVILDISVDQAAKMALSFGILQPEDGPGDLLPGNAGAGGNAAPASAGGQ